MDEWTKRTLKMNETPVAWVYDPGDGTPPRVVWSSIKPHAPAHEYWFPVFTPASANGARKTK